MSNSSHPTSSKNSTIRRFKSVAEFQIISADYPFRSRVTPESREAAARLRASLGFLHPELGRAMQRYDFKRTINQGNLVLLDVEVDEIVRRATQDAALLSAGLGKAKSKRAGFRCVLLNVNISEPAAPLKPLSGLVEKAMMWQGSDVCIATDKCQGAVTTVKSWSDWMLMSVDNREGDRVSARKFLGRIQRTVALVPDTGSDLVTVVFVNGDRRISSRASRARAKDGAASACARPARVVIVDDQSVVVARPGANRSVDLAFDIGTLSRSTDLIPSPEIIASLQHHGQ